MTEILPDSVPADVMAALQAAIAPEVEAEARNGLLSAVAKRKPVFDRFYWGPNQQGSFKFETVVDAVFGDGTWARGLTVEIAPAVAERFSPGEVRAAVGPCACRHCYRDVCAGDCDKCDDTQQCRQCHPAGCDCEYCEGDQRTCECDDCEDRTCQGECDGCRDYACGQCHPNLSDCCGYCERCEMCHTEQRNDRYGYFCGECAHCKSCGHDCDVRN